ncbi:hypothetical protein [Nocardia sp. NPDC056100]|uniref:hypothetical protein n=1 Tax=Nocardia sp. NPDC056100 TaxID=3345712 RepID=UPI0035DD8818
MQESKFSYSDQHAADMSIYAEVLSLLRDDERSAELVIAVDGPTISIELNSSLQSMIIPTEELCTAIGFMVEAHENSATGLTRAFYQYQKIDSGRWRMITDFTYDE